MKKQYPLFLGNASTDVIDALKSVQKTNFLYYKTEELTDGEEEASIEISMIIETMINKLRVSQKNKEILLNVDELAALDLALNLYRIKIYHNHSCEIDGRKIIRLYRVHLNLRYHLMDPKFKSRISG